MRVTFLAYRDWAIKAIESIKEQSEINIIDLIKTEEEYKEKVLNYPDGFVNCIVLVGWSWIIKDDTLKRFLVVGMHPSDLPMYRGGSPIQHQIIDGLEKTQITLMTISPDGVDVGDIWLKEEWDLNGSTMDGILENLSASTTSLLINFFDQFHRLKPYPQDISRGSYRKRRTPDESRVTWRLLSEMKLQDAYNLIRALGDPYPNVFIEDEEGNRLLLKEAAFLPANKQK